MFIKAEYESVKSKFQEITIIAHKYGAWTLKLRQEDGVTFVPVVVIEALMVTDAFGFDYFYNKLKFTPFIQFIAILASLLNNDLTNG